MNNLIIKEIYRASLFCKMSYYTPKQLDELFNEDNNIFADIKKVLKNNNIYFFEEEKLKVYIFQYNNTVFIIFNSSLQYKDGNCKQKLKDNIYIHSNLLNQYKFIEETICTYIEILNKNNNIKKLYITGYYMGAGVATIAAAVLGEKYQNMYLVSCFTFSAPKIGNKAFKIYYNQYVNCNYRIIINDNLHPVLSLASHNCYEYHIYKYTQYQYFKDKNYYHVSDALQLDSNSIIEFKKPTLSFVDKFVRPFYCQNATKEEVSDINCYIKRFSNIIANYKNNFVQIHSKSIEPSFREPYILRVNSTNKSGQSSSSSGSKSPKTPPINIDDSINPIVPKNFKFSDTTHT